MSGSLALIEPLVPGDTDCRGLPFMPLEVQRLLDSDLTAISTGDEFKAAVLLWCRSWSQSPAASLPDDDRILAKLASVSQSEWRDLREVALRGWLKCSDGRLYHPVIADAAIKAYSKRRGQADRANSRWAKVKSGNHENMPRHQKSVPPALEIDTAGIAPVMQGTGTGTGTGRLSEDKSSAQGLIEIDPDKDAWIGAVKVLMANGGMTEPAARKFFGGLLASNRIGARDLLAAVGSAMVNSTRDPRAYLTKAALGVNTRRIDAKPKRVGFV